MKRTILPLSLVLACSGAIAEASKPFRLERDGLKIELAPLEPDQVRAFFVARGFAPADAELIVATACVFRSAIGSAFSKDGDPEVRAAVAEWRVTPAGESARPPRTREDWETVWQQRGVGEEPATAFYWSLFPTEQTFAPTDYNWGFLTFGLPPGTRFAVELRWSSAGTIYSTQVEGLECGK